MQQVKLRRHKLALSLAALFVPTLAIADEAPVLKTVTVNAAGNPDADIATPNATTPATVYKVDREAMRLFDSPGGANPYTAVAEVPGVKITTVDAYGLNNMQGGQKGMRVRGEVSTHGVSGTVEGLSLGGPGPGPGYLFLFDKENIAGIDFAQGPMSANRAGLFNSYGALDSRLRWPEKQAGGEVNVSAGRFGFLRSFVRADSGELPTGTAFFVSASQSSAEKWRGEGNSPSARGNVEVGLSQQLGDLHFKALYAYNTQAQNNYKALTYTQASDLNRYRDVDYGTNRNSSDYYDYNKQDFQNQAFIAEIGYDFSPTTSLTIKPYYASEEGYYLYAGSTNTQVQKWLIDHETYGLSSELKTQLGSTDLKFGYAWTSTAPPGPPTTRKQYTIVGGKLVFQQWPLLSKLVDRHEFQNAYAMAEQRFSDWKLDGSLRYVHETLPGIDAYKAGAATAGASWDVSADDAIARAVKDPTRSVSSRSFDKVLPQLGATYTLTPAVDLRINAGQTIGGPAFDVFNQAPAGSITTSQQYWNQVKPEIATGVDIGARIRLTDAYLDPTIYYSRSRNKAVAVFSPASNTAYSQNVGQTAASGFQLAAGWSATNTLQLISAFSYSRSVFVENVLTTGGATLPVEGKQLPDVPRVMGNLGAVWRYQGFSVAPLQQYVGPRWGTTTYTERIPGYWLTDLTVGYEQKAHWGKWTATVGAMNLFDRRYIGQISTSEVNTTANGAIYYPGAPRTLFASLGANF